MLFRSQAGSRPSASRGTEHDARRAVERCGSSTYDQVDLDPGNRILLYTDGISEVFDERGEMLGIEGLQKFVRESSLLPFDQMLPAILERVEAWRQGPFSDDVTLVLAEVLE